MALEQSVLTADIIRTLLGEYYGLQMRSAERLPLGSANCYRVQTESGTVFLKEFQSGFSRENLLREAELVCHLKENGIPTAQFLHTQDGEPCLTYEGHLICLQEYVEGETSGYESFPPEHLSALAHMLGRLHRVLKDDSLPVDMGAEWLAAYSAEGAAAHYDRMMRLAGERADDPNTLQLLSELQYKKELAYRCGDYAKYFDGITYCATHGDYQGCQVICGADGIRAVIDFSSARTLPAVWEVMRSFVQSSVRCRRDCTIDWSELCQYVSAYMEEFSLSEQDLAAMPYVYLYQLARSKYGFAQYLSGESEDREALLRFALWRTEMCRYLEEHGEEISRRLLELR